MSANDLIADVGGLMLNERMPDFTLAAIFLFALLCSTLAFRAVQVPKPKNGMVVLNWRVFVKGLAGGSVFLTALVIGIMVKDVFG